jgi:hypothetical protein
MQKLSDVNNLIADLIRAANEVEKIGDYEIRRLIKRADAAIRDMRWEVGIPPSPMARDALIEIYIVGEHLGNYSHDQVKAALLSAAGMIRDLHIVLDTKTEIHIGQT